MILNEIKRYMLNAIDYLRERPFGQDNIDNATVEIKKAISCFDDNKEIYLIELDRFNISNDNTNATATTNGINNALIYAKENGYKGARLPQGHYAIDTAVVNNIQLYDNEEGWTSTNGWTHHRQGISMQSDMEFYMDGATLEMIPTDDPYYSIFTISHCDNIKIVGGTILGDRKTHDYGHRINENGDELESGSFDETTGLPIDDDTKVRTINYIDNYYGGELPTNFRICPLENTTMNTVDGGCRYIYCYDENDNYLGMTEGGIGFLSQATLPEGTKKIKVSIKGERRLDAKLYITTRELYYTHEFGTGITIADSHNIEIKGVTVKDCIGDCICPFAPPLKITVDNLSIIDCTLENSRRQGISFVATGENYLIKNCNIGKINGTDPQAGIDFEHYDYVRNTVFDGCNFYDNKKWDIINYNGWDIEIKNCTFNGGIGSTYGYNMLIHDNIFKYEDNIDKIHKTAIFSLGTDKTDEDGAYFKIYNNVIDGYMKEDGGGGGSTSRLSASEFRNNTVKNSSLVLGSNVYDNYYENSRIRYSKVNYEYKDEEFKNCVIGGENSSDGTPTRYYTNFTMNNCEFTGGSPSVKDTILTNCHIYNNDKPFVKIWSGKYTLDNCDITTEYESNIAFISNQGCDATYKNCTMNLATTPFVSVNYGSFIMSNCNIQFNESFKEDTTINFFKNGYGTYEFIDNVFVKEFDIPKIKLPSSSTVNGIYYEDSVIV